MHRILIIAIIAAAVILGALFWSQWRHEPFFVSGFIESHQIRVGSRVGGRVALVHVHEGQMVEQGAPLLELDPYDLNERRAEAKAALAAQEATLAKRVSGPRKEEIEGARAARDRVQADWTKPSPAPVRKRSKLPKARWPAWRRNWQKHKKILPVSNR